MLSKKNRISKKEFSHILTFGKRYNSNNLMFYIALNSNKENKNRQSKFSFSVSKKVEGSAVKRNKLRRQGYSIINRYIKQIKENTFLFFVFKKGSNTITFNNLEKEIFGLLSTSGMLL